ncbi:MAG: hypothetical protein KIS86_14835 [Devosia sp.]|nr:hypothetical protein [Devosia sp.]
MRHVACLAVFFCLALPVSAEPFHHAFGEWREYSRDWLAACPDAIDEDAADFYGYSCFASTGSATLNSAGLPAYKLTLIRNRLNGELDIALTVAPDKGSYDPARPMLVRFAGAAPITLLMDADLETRHNTANQFFITNAHLRQRLVETMKERAALTLAVPLAGQQKPVETRLSLQGVMGSLDFMATYARKVAQY